QRLLELELQGRRVRRVDAGRQVGELVLGVEGDAGDAAGGQRLEDGAGEAGGVGLDGVERAGAAGLELVQGRADGPVGDVPVHAGRVDGVELRQRRLDVGAADGR